MVYHEREGGVGSGIHHDKSLVTMLTNETLKKREGEERRRETKKDEERRRKKKEGRRREGEIDILRR